MTATDCECAACQAIPERDRLASRLPFGALLALSMAAFVTVLTEAMPAGLLPRMSADLNVLESLIGQLVTMYAVGSLIAAIPLTVATQGWRRRPLLLTAIGGFAVVNAVTAVSSNYLLTLGARFFAGVFAGLLWALVAGYAGRMVPENLKGRAIAVVMAGIPLALSFGIPAAAYLGAIIGWRIAFGIMSIIAVVLVGWVAVKVPDFPGQPAHVRPSAGKVLLLPGVRAVLFVTLTFVLAHNLLYTYIAPFVVPAGLADNVDIVLFVFGVFALLGIWITGLLIDRWLRTLVLVSTGLFIVVAAVLGFWGSAPAVVCCAVGAWGLAVGGIATLFQTASAKTAGDAADVAQSMLVTVWNIAIAGGGLIGGVLLENFGVASMPWALLALLVPTLFVAWRAKAHGFPPAMR